MPPETATPRRSLLVRMGIGFIVSVVLTVALAAVITGHLWRRAERPIELYRRHLVQLNGMLLRDLVATDPAALARFRDENPDVGVTVINDGVRVGGSDDLPIDYRRFFARGIQLPDGARAHTYRGIEYVATQRGSAAVILAFRFDVLPTLMLRFLLTVAVATMLGFFLLYHYVRRLLAPAEKMLTATVALAQGRLETRLPAVTHADFAALYASFNAMAARLQAIVANDLLLLGNLSHDLRYYLTRLRMTAEVEVGDPAVRQSLTDDLGALEQYLERVLEAFRTGSRQIQYRREPVDVSALLQALRSEWPDVTFAIEPGVQTVTDALAFGQILVNLLDNARKYGRNLRLTLRTVAGRFRCEVANETDLQLPTEELTLLLQPFFRADPARTEHNRGTGLGLFIVKATADALDLALDLEWQHDIFMVTVSGPSCPRSA